MDDRRGATLFPQTFCRWGDAIAFNLFDTSSIEGEGGWHPRRFSKQRFERDRIVRKGIVCTNDIASMMMSRSRLRCILSIASVVGEARRIDASFHGDEIESRRSIDLELHNFLQIQIVCPNSSSHSKFPLV